MLLKQDSHRSVQSWAPVSVSIFGALVSLVFTPFWAGLLNGELPPTCTLEFRAEADTSCQFDSRHFLLPVLLVAMIQLFAVVWLVIRAVQGRRPASRTARQLSMASAIALIPLGAAGLFGTSSQVSLTGEFVAVLWLCAAAAIAAVWGGVVRRRWSHAIAATVNVVLLIVATIEVFAIIPSSSLAIAAMVASLLARQPFEERTLTERGAS